MRQRGAMTSSPPPPAPSSRRRIFLISFNKCGTSSFDRLFRRNGIASCHHGGNDPVKNLALNMFKNFMLARDPLVNIDEYTAYTDLAYYVDGMFYEGARLYPYLHDHYPDSYFIIAVRNIDAWILSRLAHRGSSLAPRAASALGDITHQEVASLWRDQFRAHNDEVRGYFARHPEARFLEFDLEAGDPRRIADFLADDFTIDVAHWGQRNITSESARQRVLKRMDLGTGGEQTPLRSPAP